MRTVAQVEFYRRRRANGMCGACATSPADAGMATCGECRRRVRARNALLVAHGKCVSCRGEAIGGRQHCHDCGVKAFIRTHRKLCAKARGLEDLLTDEQIRWIIHQPCHYCGSVDNRGFNGIDRVTSTAGYNVANVVTCCWHCNTAKSDMEYEEFIAWVYRTADHLRSQN